MIIFLDESIGGVGNGVYIVAGVALRASDKEGVRRDLRRLVPPGHRFHFHREKTSTRLAVLRLLGEATAASFAYRVSPAPSRYNESARQRCLSAFIDDLPVIGATEVVIESRQELNDHRDRRLFQDAHLAGRLADRIRYGHQVPGAEPLLWLVFVSAGAAVARARKWAPSEPVTPLRSWS